MTALSALILKATAKIKAWVVSAFAVRPSLIFVHPPYVGNLQATLFFFLVQTDNGKWVAIHTQQANTIIIKESKIINFCFQHWPRIMMSFQAHQMFYPTGLYVPLPLHLRITSNVLVLTAQFPNVEITEEFVAAILPQIVNNVNAKPAPVDAETTTQPVYGDVDLATLELPKTRMN